MVRWLRDVPVADPLDRRNAPFVQGLLIFYVAFIAINKTLYLWAVYGGDWPARQHLASDVATDVLMCIAALMAVVMIRRGRFREAVWVFIGTVLAITAYIYALVDIHVVAFEVFPLMLVALTGLVLGRRTLWTVAGFQVGCYLLCMVSNLTGVVRASVSDLAVVGITVSTIGSYLLMAIIIDCATSTLRHSLDEAVAKSRRLEEEMAERERTQEQLLHARKMEVVGQVASGVAHDFDNVLSVILGYTSRRERLADAGEGKLIDAMEGIHIAAERASMVSRNLLRFARFEAEQTEVVDVRDVMRAVEPMLRQLFGARVRMACRMPSSPLPIVIDRAQLELIFLSMASNARDAMSEGGVFTMRACRDGGSVVVELADTGRGIAAEHVERIFDPFFTTKPPGSGTGLGLSVVHDVVEHAGGHIGVHGRPGGGTVFVMRFPVAGREQVVPVMTEAPLLSAACH